MNAFTAHRYMLPTLIVSLLFLQLRAFEVKAQSPAQNPPPTRAQLVKEFDSDSDGRLDESERVKMIEAITKRAGLNRSRDSTSRSQSADGTGNTEVSLMAKFDEDRDGRLNAVERAAARQEARLSKQQRGSRGGRPGGLNRSAQANPGSESTKPGRPLKPGDVQQFEDQSLYDALVLRTIFLTFEETDWETELHDFYRTDVEIPAGMSVDGRTFAPVGVRIRGNTSSRRVPIGRKKSLNISLDYTEKDQKLYGYKTLNLLNAHTDPTMMREVLFSRIARNYMPALQANYVRLVINGESWGLYVNSQQFNKDFLEEAFGTRGGVRWKKPASPRQGGGLKYDGERMEDYEGFYQLKTEAADMESAWGNYIEFARTMAETPIERLEETLDPYLDIDGALWFLAMENVFIDRDGYWIRASDFNFYQDPSGRFHMISHDNNETFKYPGGPGFQGQETANFKLDPLFGMKDAKKPLLRLLENDALRARYLAHVRTISEDWLSWEKISPMVETYKQLIEEVVRQDTRMLDTYEHFLSGITQNQGSGNPGLKHFVEGRGKYLLNHSVIAPSPVSITSVHTSPVIRDNNTLGRWQLATTVTAQVGDGDDELYSLAVYASTNPMEPYRRVEMTRQRHGVYQVSIAALPPGETLYYYLEARGISEKTGSSYYPRTAAYKPLKLALQPDMVENQGLVISEVMASNKSTITDPQGEYEDWIELHNTTNHEIELSEYYLSDNGARPLKWKFPDGIVLAAGKRTLIWADEDKEKTKSGDLHANFKLAVGESITLAKQKSGNILVEDFLSLQEMKPDQSLSKEGITTQPTPGH
jgi:hypothetical protein